MNLTKRLKDYKEREGLTNEGVHSALREAGIVAKIETVSNWLRSQTEPSPMYRKGLENFLANSKKD